MDRRKTLAPSFLGARAPKTWRQRHGARAKHPCATCLIHSRHSSISHPATCSRHQSHILKTCNSSNAHLSDRPGGGRPAGGRRARANHRHRFHQQQRLGELQGVQAQSCITVIRFEDNSQSEVMGAQARQGGCLRGARCAVGRPCAPASGPCVSAGPRAAAPRNRPVTEPCVIALAAICTVHAGGADRQSQLLPPPSNCGTPNRTLDCAPDLRFDPPSPITPPYIYPTLCFWPG